MLIDAIVHILEPFFAFVGFLTFIAGCFVGYAFHASCQHDKDMKRAQLDQEKALPGITAQVEAYKIQEQARYNAYVEYGETLDEPDEQAFLKNYMRVSEEDMARIRQNILDRVFPPTESKDDQIARRLLDSLDSSETNGGEA